MEKLPQQQQKTQRAVNLIHISILATWLVDRQDETGDLNQSTSASRSSVVDQAIINDVLAAIKASMMYEDHDIQIEFNEQIRDQNGTQGQSTSQKNDQDKDSDMQDTNSSTDDPDTPLKEWRDHINSDVIDWLNRRHWLEPIIDLLPFESSTFDWMLPVYERMVRAVRRAARGNERRERSRGAFTGQGVRRRRMSR
jgi:hypothetical protein